MNRIGQRIAIFFLLTQMGGQLLAEEEIATGKFVVSLTSDGNQKPWIVNALEQNIYNDLSGYARIVPFKKEAYEDQLCIDRNTDCILEIYKKLEVDALMLGTVDNSDIEYEIYDIQNKYLVQTGSIEIGTGSSLLKLRMGAFRAFKPFIEKGGILENRKYNAIADAEADDATDEVIKNYSATILKSQVLMFLAGFTCFPYLFSFLGKPLRHPARSKVIFRWFYPFMVVSLLVIGLQFVLEATGTGNVLDIIYSFFDGYHWILAAVSGIFWGFFFIINFKIVIPHLQGIERIEPKNLVPLLQSCLITLLIKTIIVAGFCFGFFYGVLYLGNLFSMSQEVILLFLFPLSGLYIFYWVALMLEVFSMSIDVKLSGRKFDFQNVWSLKIRKYFIGYLKRNGVTLNKKLVKSIVFLPGVNKGVACYGGGFSGPRITIGKDLLKFALGDIDETNLEDIEEYDKKAIAPVLRQNSAFQITANLTNQRKAKKLFKSRQEKKRIKRLENMQKFFQRDLKSQGHKHNDRLENSAQGIILARLEGDDDLPSLMSDNLEEMQVLEEILLEFSALNHRYDEDAEIDDSSEEDKDFLFGALLHKFGGILRHEDIFSTLQLYLPRRKKAKERTYNFLFSKYFAVVADTFVVLNFGLNHLMQHLYYQATESTSHLTTKGITSGLLVSQDEILTCTKEITDERKPRIIQTDELDRIVWLSKFCQESIRNQRQPIIQPNRVFKWAFSLGVTYLASIVLINSYNYHPIYTEIIAKEKQVIADAIENEKEKERKKNEG